MDEEQLEDKIMELGKKGYGRPAILEELEDKGATEWQVRTVLKELRSNKEELTEREKKRLEKNKRPTHYQTISSLQPIEVRVPRNRRKKAKDSGLTTIAFVGDTHAPYDDPRAVDVACQIIEDVKPNMLVHVGDLVDFYTVSDYTKDPNRRVTLQDELEAASKILGKLSQTVSTDTPKVIVEGNHENRLRRYIESNAPALATLPELQVKRLLGVESVGWEYVDYDKEVFPEFIVKHGDKISKHSGYTAKRELEESWMSGISGHTHRQAIHRFMSRRTYLRDEPAAMWIENGCLCETNVDYINGNGNWQQGFSILHFAEDGHIIPELINISQGRAYHNGRLYKG